MLKHSTMTPLPDSGKLTLEWALLRIVFMMPMIVLTVHILKLKDLEQLLLIKLLLWKLKKLPTKKDNKEI